MRHPRKKCGKDYYPKWTDAFIALTEIRESGRKAERVYRCHLCSGFHITTKPYQRRGAA